MEKATTDIYTFDNLSKRGHSYVGKTAILKELVDALTSYRQGCSWKWRHK